jgi:hypothetical protein
MVLVKHFGQAQQATGSHHAALFAVPNIFHVFWDMRKISSEEMQMAKRIIHKKLVPANSGKK